ncbi:hypothetical protein ACF3NV_00720 [Moraxella atlantae]|uniref:hypothetical protein n=1 Tax=Faucicola atlantae TaxID=34059 RepID=UPI003751BFC4
MPNQTINRARQHDDRAALYDNLTLYAEQLSYLATLIDLARADLTDTPPHIAHRAKSLLDIMQYLVADFSHDVDLQIERMEREGQA